MAAVAAVAFIAGAVLLWSLLGSDGVSRDEAIEIAGRHVAGAASATFVSASSGRVGDFDSSVGQDSDRFVWEVAFEGEFKPAGCGPLTSAATPGPCRYGPNPIARVYLDEQTGDFVMMAYTGD